MTGQPAQRPSATTSAALAFVDDHRAPAARIAARLVALVDDPERFAAALDDGLAALADPVFAEGLLRVAPGIEGAAGVRGPLLGIVESGVRRDLRGVEPARVLAIADRVGRSGAAESRWFAIHLMDGIVLADPERTWQLMRGVARSAREWITVDTLASPYARGVLAEPYRWSEIEQVVFSPSAWERRLAGSSIARMPYVDRARGRRPQVAERGLEVIGSLIGDSSPDVQKALSWALRTLALLDSPTVARFCLAQAEQAAAQDDGHRAWVLRDAAPKLPARDAEAIRTLVAGIRRRPGSSSTSTAALTAARFGELPPPASHPMAPFP